MKEKDDMEKNRKFRTITIVALIIAILCLSVGYASFNTLLNINSATYFASKNWYIKFDNLSDPVITNDAKVLEKASVTSTSIDLKIALSKPGDAVSYTFDVSNAGNIDAILGSLPTISGIPDSLSDTLIYELRYDDNSNIDLGDELNAGDSHKVRLTIKYDGKNIPIDAKPIDIVSNVQILFLYLQK